MESPSDPPARPAPSPPAVGAAVSFRWRPAGGGRGRVWGVLALVVGAGMAASFTLAGGLEGGSGGSLAGFLGSLAAVAFVPVVAAIAVVDARHFIIPDTLNGAGLALGLLYAAASGGSELLAVALARGAGLALAFWAVRVAYRALRKREGLGLGDVKLAGVAGAWLDVTAIPLAIEMAALAALLGVGIAHLAGGRTARLDRRLPFGLFFAPAIWAAWGFDRMVWGGL